jgi:hypothetical protein
MVTVVVVPMVTVVLEMTRWHWMLGSWRPMLARLLMWGRFPSTFVTLMPYPQPV